MPRSRSDGVVHIFYRDATSKDLRHAWGSGTSWSREVLDGNGGSGGRISGDIGTDVSAVVQNGKIHVFYRAVGNGNLRHASWSGSAWTFATLDGESTSGGRVDADVGVGSSAFLFNNAVNVTYFNATAGDLRRAVLSGSAWTFETLDGAGGADGRTANVVGRASTAAVASNQLFLWYRDDTAKDLRLARMSGSTWSFSTLDGNGGGRGRTTNDVASVASGAALGAEPHVWYYDATGGDLRHGWRNTSNEWTFETVDGNETSAGGIDVQRRDVHSGGHVRFDGGRPLPGRDRREPAQRILQRRGMVVLHPRRCGRRDRPRPHQRQRRSRRRGHGAQLGAVRGVRRRHERGSSAGDRPAAGFLPDGRHRHDSVSRPVRPATAGFERAGGGGPDRACHISQGHVLV